MSKIKWALVFGAGYVAGSAAGRQRYEQIKAGAQRVTGNPRVQSAAKSAQQTVAEKAPVVADAVKTKAGEAASAVQDKVHDAKSGSHDQPQPHAPEAATGRPPLS